MVKGCGSLCPSLINERQLQIIWRNRLFRQDGLVTEDGRKVRVKFPGFLNGEAGPDFVRAVIDVDGEELKGDVELHLYPSGWYQHAHHSRQDYSNVILEVVLRREDLELGSKVPRLILEPYLQGSILELVKRLEGLEVPWGDRIEPMLGEAGKRRFDQKVKRIEYMLYRGTPDQVLYRGIMRALGYKANKEGFEELARLVPYEGLRGRTLAEIESMLLKEARGIRWRLGFVRPANHPYRRIRGMAGFLSWLGGRGLAKFFEGQFVKQGQARQAVKGLIKLCQTDPASRRGIGRSRWGLIIFNVVLPFICSQRPELRDQIVSIYITHPPIQDGFTPRVCKDLGVNRASIRSVCDQMGLWYLYRLR
jgi:hypothetical protein